MQEDEKKSRVDALTDAVFRTVCNKYYVGAMIATDIAIGATLASTPSAQHLFQRLQGPPVEVNTIAVTAPPSYIRGNLRPDARDMIISLLSPKRYWATDLHLINNTERMLGKTPTLAQINANDARNAISDIVETVGKQVAQKGKLHDVMIVADGVTGGFAVSEPMTAKDTATYSGEESPSLPGIPIHRISPPGMPAFYASDFSFEMVQVKDVLDALQTLQQEKFGGKPMADRIIFSACSVAAGVDKKTAQSYFEASRKLGVPIVMATSDIVSTDNTRPLGFFVQFNPDGTYSIPRDINNPTSLLSPDMGWLKDFTQSKMAALPLPTSQQPSFAAAVTQSRHTEDKSR
jgi:hypothetical protein